VTIRNEDVIKNEKVLDFLCDNDFLEYLKVLSDNEGKRIVTSLCTSYKEVKTYYILIKYEEGNLDLIKGLNKDDLIQKLKQDLAPFLAISQEDADQVIEHINIL
jgi:hypothetical protein